jgi:hypothetical protein
LGPKRPKASRRDSTVIIKEWSDISMTACAEYHTIVVGRTPINGKLLSYAQITMAPREAFRCTQSPAMTTNHKKIAVDMADDYSP